MADPTNVIQHDFGFPRVIGAEDAERAALYAMLVSLGATKIMAERLMQDYPQHRIAAQAIVDFASDGESDMRGAIAKLEEPDARRRWRGGASRAHPESLPIRPFRRDLHLGGALAASAATQMLLEIHCQHVLPEARDQLSPVDRPAPGSARLAPDVIDHVRLEMGAERPQRAVPVPAHAAFKSRTAIFSCHSAHDFRNG